MLLLNGTCTKKTAPNTQAVLPVEISSARMPVDSIPTTLDSNCHLFGPVIRQVFDKEGYVSYRGDVPLYSIETTPPYNSDAVTIGYVCNMPDKFKRATLKVRFSGKYYHAYKYIKQETGGETNLYLQLDSIRIAPF